MRRVLVAVLLLSGCGGGPSFVHVDTAALRRAAALAQVSFTRLQVRAEGAGMTTVVADVSPTAETFEMEVPAGSARHFSIDAVTAPSTLATTFGLEELPVYQGELTVDLAPGDVRLDLPVHEVATLALRLATSGAALPSEIQLSAGAMPLTAVDGIVIAVVPPGTYDIVASYDDSGETFSHLPLTVTLGPGELAGGDLALFSPSTKCDSSAPEVLAVAPVCRALEVTVSGLLGSGLVLTNGADNLSVAADGSFSFARLLPDGASYDVAVSTQPSSPHQTCTGGSGVMNATLGPVAVSCGAPFFTVGGHAHFFGGSGLKLGSEVGPTYDIQPDGDFVLPLEVSDGASYFLAVRAQPSGGWNCSLIHGSGVVSGADVTDLAIYCASPVAAMYPGADEGNINAWRRLSDASVPCDGSEPAGDGCFQAGLVRTFVVPGLTSCTDVSASDSLGALEWQCSEEPGQVRLTSQRLVGEAWHLFNFSSGAYQPAVVSVSSDVGGMSTRYAAFWSGAVEIDNTGGPLTTAGTVYLVNTDPVLNDLEGSYVPQADFVTLLVDPTYALYVANNTPAFAADGVLAPWFEGDVLSIGSFDATPLISYGNAQYGQFRYSNLVGTGGEIGFSASACDYLVVDTATARGAQVGFALDTVSQSRVANITVSACGDDGFRLVGMGDRIDGLAAFSNVTNGLSISGAGHVVTLVDVGDNGLDGVFASAADDLVLSRVRAFNNGAAGGSGVHLQGLTRARVADVVAASNGGGTSGAGFYLENVNHSVVQNVTATASRASSGGNVFLNGASHNYLARIIASVAYESPGLRVTAGGNNRIVDLVTAMNYYGVSLTSTNDNSFEGVWGAGDNSFGDCTISGGTNPGLAQGPCRVAGTSNATYVSSIDMSGAWLGPFGSSVAHDDVSIIWTGLGGYASRGRDVSLPPSGGLGPCMASDNCAFFDWSLSGTSAAVHVTNAASVQVAQVLLGLVVGSQAECPPNSTFSASDCQIAFFAGALESEGDGDTLCEGGEICVESPNAGAYQGEGPFSPSGLMNAAVGNAVLYRPSAYALP